MNISSQDFKELAIPHFAQVFDKIDKVLGSHDIPYYLIGANAIAVRFLMNGKRPPRGTADIDFAIMVSTREDYEAIVHDLVAEGFKNVDEPYRFYFSDQNTVVDMLPFANINEDNTENFVERDAFLYAYGLENVLSDADKTMIDQKLVGIPPLPAMVILKLVAFADNWERRQKDLGDILTVIEHFYELVEDEILEQHYDTFVDADEFDRLKISARVLGRKAVHWLRKSPQLEEVIITLLEDNLVEDSRSRIAEDWARRMDWDITYAQSILRELKKGLLE